jgi:hypothetical protein
MESKVKDFYRIQQIIHKDYSNYENPIREILEYRKQACLKLDDNLSSAKEIREVIEYCDTLIKRHFDLGDD